MSRFHSLSSHVFRSRSRWNGYTRDYHKAGIFEEFEVTKILADASMHTVEEFS